jgi:phage shock protein PspC (stress-responsive transcriptional regulator)
MALFCHHCGTELPVGARFCSSCGAGISGGTTTSSRPLVRPIAGRHIAGVCLGVAQAYGWDVALVRIFSVIGIFCSGGLVVVAYLAGWIGIPEEQPPLQ